MKERIKGMKITGRTQMLQHQYGTRDIFRIFSEQGLDGVEFSFEDKQFKPRFDMLDDYFIDYVYKQSVDYQMPIMAAGTHLNFIDSDEIFEYIKIAIGKTPRLFTDTYIFTAPATDIEYVNHTLQREKAIERMKYLVEIAEKSGIRLALEPEPNHIFSTTDDVMGLLEEIKSDALCINFDIGHSFLLDEDIHKAIQLLDKKIIHCHVENMPRGRHIHLLPWEGHMDLKEVFDTLKTIGFDGAMAMDLYHYDYEKVCGEACKYIKELW